MCCVKCYPFDEKMYKDSILKYLVTVIHHPRCCSNAKWFSIYTLFSAVIFPNNRYLPTCACHISSSKWTKYSRCYWIIQWPDHRPCGPVSNSINYNCYNNTSNIDTNRLAILKLFWYIKMY